ncbi:MAG: hypothetical protein ACYTX0_49950 [Nostoc sp.]
MTTRQKLGRIAQLSLDVLQPEAALELLRSLLKGLSLVTLDFTMVKVYITKLYPGMNNV